MTEKLNDFVETAILYTCATIAGGPLAVYDKMITRREKRRHENRQYMTTEDFAAKYFPNR